MRLLFDSDSHEALEFGCERAKVMGRGGGGGQASCWGAGFTLLLS
jgi:hypothetical protein